MSNNTMKTSSCITTKTTTTTTTTCSGALEEDEWYPKTAQEEWNEIAEAFYANTTEEELRRYQTRFVADRALKVGCTAPLDHFELPDQDGDIVRLNNNSSRRGGESKTIVLSFYRGKWCPHSNPTLRMLASQLLPKLQAKGGGAATLIAVSPVLPDGTQYLSSKQSLQFPICSDVKSVVAKHFGITFQVTLPPEDTRGEIVPNSTSTSNDDANHPTWEIPVPATFVIDPNGTIVWSFVDDHQQQQEQVNMEDMIDEILQAIPSSTTTTTTTCCKKKKTKTKNEDPAATTDNESSSSSSSSTENCLITEKKQQKQRQRQRRKKSGYLPAAAAAIIGSRSNHPRESSSSSDNDNDDERRRSSSSSKQQKNSMLLQMQIPFRNSFRKLFAKNNKQQNSSSLCLLGQQQPRCCCRSDNDEDEEEEIEDNPIL